MGGVVIVGVSMTGSSMAAARMAVELPLVVFVLDEVAFELRALDRTQKVMASAES